MSLSIKGEFKGRYRLQVVNADGSIETDTGEFDNIILDQWFDSTNGAGAVMYGVIGMGVVTPPAFTDTALGNQVAVSSNYKSSNSANELVVINGDSFAKTIIGPLDFSGVSGDVSEVGLRMNSPSGPLVSRTLVKDGSGNPTTIAISSDQTLRVYYCFYFKIPSDGFASGTVNVDGVDYPWSASFSDATISQNGSLYLGNTDKITGYYTKPLLKRTDGTYAAFWGTLTTNMSSSYDETVATATMQGDIVATEYPRQLEAIAVMCGVITNNIQCLTIDFPTPIPVPANNKVTISLSYGIGRLS